MSERETKFTGFADLLVEEMKPDLAMLFIALGSPLATREQEVETATTLIKSAIARRAYDLVCHALFHANLGHLDDGFPLEEAKTVKDVPDLTVWPPL